jgi:putative (di)nucleoside polyphosphate hydrolase
MVVFNVKGLVFVGQRWLKPDEPQTDYYQFPQGGIDLNESPIQAARRELTEEIGLSHCLHFIGSIPYWLLYDFPDHVRPIENYCGQKQLWFAFLFTGQDTDICIDQRNPEFRHWKWEALQATPQQVIPFKKNIYQKVVDQFSRLWH